jgi:hypothetical protein
MLYSGAKGTMTPNNRLQRTASESSRPAPASVRVEALSSRTSSDSAL